MTKGAVVIVMIAAAPSDSGCCPAAPPESRQIGSFLPAEMLRGAAEEICRVAQWPATPDRSMRSLPGQRTAGYRGFAEIDLGTAAPASYAFFDGPSKNEIKTRTLVSDRVRLPRQPLQGAERQRVEKVIADALATRPQLPSFA